ncbi:hypothetical protein BB560_003680 [Smittium megazygosporum]|uniref:AMP-dependent synthetase/ligase domain-containing protein n=1 Tax=Smittium megazygosporum TaxID=133381 RepID=A0A2T9ZBA7_9FUNG|nr:hypothetical protein BB560_003680 [Smittium megazygosporum]
MYFKDPLPYIIPNSEEEGYTPALQSPKKEYIGHRPYDPVNKVFLPFVFQTYAQVSERITNFGAGLVNLRLEVSESDEEREFINNRKWPVAIYSVNRPEWNIADRSLATQSLYSVGLYDSLGKDAMEYILNHSEASVIVCSIDKISKVLLNIYKLPKLKFIISMDLLSEGSTDNKFPKGTFVSPSQLGTKSANVLKNWAKHLNIPLYDFHQVEEIGKNHPIPHHPPKPDDIYTLVYTSGTTGNPKSVVSSHKNYTAAAIAKVIDKITLPHPVILSFLPLQHAYGRTMENYATLAQGTIGYFCGDITKIIEDCQALNPTFFPGVPRLLSRFYDILSSATIHSGGIYGKICKFAVNSKVKHLHTTNSYTHPFWDKVIFYKTRYLLGNRLVAMNTGTAPLSSSVMDFLRVSLCSIISEGYAMTETSSSGVGQTTYDFSNGNVGIPHPGVELRLRSVPEMNYLVTDIPRARGEVLMRGANIFDRYLKDEKNTAEALIGDGWVASGDIGQLNENGTLSIVDRKKTLFKTSQGVYISPEKVEAYLTRHRLIMQAFVHGFSSENCIVAIIVPDPVHFIPWATNIIKSKNRQRLEMETKNSTSLKEITKDKLVISKFLEEIRKFSIDSGLSGLETVRAINLESTPFDIENNKLLTPTLKIKRFDAIKYYTDTIKRLYSSIID